MDKEKIALAAYGPTSPVTKFSGTSYDDKLNKVTAAVSERAGKKVEASQVLLHLAATLGAIVITTSSKDWRMKEYVALGAARGWLLTSAPQTGNSRRTRFLRSPRRR